MNILLAWRNIWRNPRRTAVILAAVVIGLWSMIFLGALMRGVAEQMVRNGIATLTGHIQIHHKGYRDDPAIENSMAKPEEVEAALTDLLPPGTRYTSRVRVNAVAANARHSTGLTLVGIAPTEEAPMSFISRAVTRGRFLETGDRHGIVVGRALADKFETKLGRKLVLMSQGTDSEIASKVFRIVGIFRSELEATEKQFAFVTMSAAQQMLKLGKAISEVSVLLPSRKDIAPVAAALRNRLSPSQYEVHTWEDLLPLINAILKMYDAFIFIWFLVVFIAMGFGIVNTTLMAVFERIREFGLLKALGMKPWWIIRGILTESFLLLVLGTIMGNVLGLSSIFALSGKGIDLTALAAGIEFTGLPRIIYPAILVADLVAANLVVVVLGLLVSLYPAVKAARFTPVEAMAHT